MMNWTDENIVFVISLPRSGSTLLQRILSIHPSICTTSETWLLLPQIYTLKENCVFSEYNATAASRALSDLCEYIDKGQDVYKMLIKRHFIDMVQRTADRNQTIFVEKTPRNNLIIEDIYNLFPESKYIFLWRNPAAVVASMINSFSNGKWNIYRQEIDLYKGLDNMIRSNKLKIKNRLDIRYEDLVHEPRKHTSEIIKFIGLRDGISIECMSNNSLTGRMGDKTGINRYNSVSTKSVNNWTDTYCNVLRRKWLKNYLKYIGNNNMSNMGYNREKILNELRKQNNNKHIYSDALRMLYGVIDRNYHVSVIRKLRKARIYKRKYMLQ
ncbi:MAG: sulfotransferase [Candidatus Thiodiazotropha sp.]